jgi:hypothetical protein
MSKEMNIYNLLLNHQLLNLHYVLSKAQMAHILF